MKNYLLFVLACCYLTTLPAQRNRYYEQERNNEGGALLLNFSYGFQVPGGDLADRFGNNFTTGGGLDYLTKNNYIIGLQSNFQFGANVWQDVLTNLRNEDGVILGDDGALSEIKLRERGIYLGAHIGKLFAISSTNKRSGIRVTVGGGFLQHKIRIQDDPQITIALLSDEYKKGYDRLTNGWALMEFIGYQYLAKNHRINIMAGFEFTQGFTENRRNFNFDTRSREEGKRLDLLSGFRLSWTLPFYVGANPDELRY